MADNKDTIIVAIELGTSHISGIAGKRVNGNMQILAYAEEPSAGCIRRGKVFNIEKTTQNIRNVVDKLQSTLGKTIAQVYVGIGGQSVRSVHNHETRNMVTKSYITADHIEALRNQSFETPYPNSERLATFEQGYIIDSTPVEEPVGVMGTNIEGEYLNIIANHQLRDNIETCFAKTDVCIAGTKVAAYELAQNVLTDQEKRAGSVLVDLGAGTTTVVVYKNNIVMFEKIDGLAGTSPWILMDFRSPRRQLPNIQDFFNRKGLVSSWGEKKKAFYVMQEWYRKKAAEYNK